MRVTDLITRNFFWKLLSVMIAVLLWMILVAEQEMTTSLSATVQYRNMPRGLELSSELIDAIHLEVRGPANQLGPAMLANTALQLDLSTLSAGERTISVGQNNVNLPRGVELLRAVPGQIRIRLEPMMIREVPVQVRFAGPPPPGFRLEDPEVSPPRLRIAGPASKVNQVEVVQTDPVDLSMVKDRSATFQVNTFVGEPHVRFETNSMVTVKVVLEKAR